LKKQDNNEIELNTYDHNFGFVLPMHTNVFWENQTNGVCCNHVQIEGVFVPLPMEGEIRKILAKIQDANYDYKPKKVASAWIELKKRLKENEDLEFEKVESPIHNPENQEGLVWVKITRWNSCIGHGVGMVGKIVALYYPNCD
jgi:hypothetical protein